MYTTTAVCVRVRTAVKETVVSSKIPKRIVLSGPRTIGIRDSIHNRLSNPQTVKIDECLNSVFRRSNCSRCQHCQLRIINSIRIHPLQLHSFRRFDNFLYENYLVRCFHSFVHVIYRRSLGLKIFLIQFIQFTVNKCFFNRDHHLCASIIHFTQRC